MTLIIFMAGIVIGIWLPTALVLSVGHWAHKNDLKLYMKDKKIFCNYEGTKS